MKLKIGSVISKHLGSGEDAYLGTVYLKVVSIEMLFNETTSINDQPDTFVMVRFAQWFSENPGNTKYAEAPFSEVAGWDIATDWKFEY